MNWALFLQLTTTLVIALIGGWLGHYLSARRDLRNERRRMRVSYLLEAYRRLETFSSNAAKFWDKTESAIADIQLLGSPTQVELARSFALDLARDGSANLDPLMADLRKSCEMNLTLSE